MFSRALCIQKGVPNAFAVRLLGPACFQRSETTAAKTPPAPKEEAVKSPAVHKEDGRAEYPGKVRFAFLPDEWFTFFYKKTGVTGPYLFGTGLLTFLLSKELYVVEHEFSTGCALFFLIYIACKKFGPAGREYINKDFEARLAEHNKDKENAIKNLTDMMAEEQKNVWYTAGQKVLMEAKRENVQMQLETEYRRRMMQVYEQVKKRLDYQLDMYNTKRKLEQKHMVDWIVNSVVKSITPQQEKEALQKCIEDLKVMATKA
ncbi:ATP synthase subunit b, mitochondrial [Trichonephila inaurata madagascariensis]|uniref:ATP synthase subunit b n=1 Tax=Trichonephila inaurata madagascariensis TaxID=2747483 RepID=A0A8X6YR80_9ARAC|nr:ATP synthase subunit b, mitochondrial [Trichonephila inaurata madagascariensis]